VRDSRFEFEVRVSTIRPIGDNCFAAKLAWMKERTPSGVKDHNTHVGEFYGATREEAERKVEAAAEDWIAKQPLQP
jgi:hypothetical protein